jgi:hypothetical protein
MGGIWRGSDGNRRVRKGTRSKEKWFRKVCMEPKVETVEG